MPTDAPENVETPATDTPETDKTAPAGTAANANTPSSDKTIETRESDKPDTKQTSLLDGADDDDDTAAADKSAETGDDKNEKDDGKPAASDWRDELFAEITKGLDEKLSAKDLKKRQDAIRNELKRYKTPADYMKAGYAARQKLASGEYKLAQLPENATEDEIKAYRAAHGVPEKPTDYEIPAVAGLKWTDADKTGLAAFTERMHKINAPQSVVAEAAVWWKETVEAAKEANAEAVIAKDAEDRAVIEDNLRAKLGAEYRPAIKLFSRLLNDAEVFPDGVGERIATARFDDGTRVINDPVVAEFFINLARERYGEGAMITGDAKAQMESEEEKIRSIMKNDFNRYIKEGWDKKLTSILERKSGGKRAAS
jgi:hypothetical protein